MKEEIKLTYIKESKPDYYKSCVIVTDDGRYHWDWYRTSIGEIDCYKTSQTDRIIDEIRYWAYLPKIEEL